MAPHDLLLAAALLLHAASLVACVREAFAPAVALLAAGSLALRLWAVTIDPFLHVWDEQFHALVAKNLLLDPLRPILNPAPALPFDRSIWTENHVWLHKPPLALWQIAASLRLLGQSELAVRLPSAIAGSATVLLAYRIGALAVGRTAGFYAALLLSLSSFQLRLASGAIPTDHVDVTFIAYVTASFWGLSEILSRPRRRWVAAIGVFGGLAVLTKWLVGLLVFPAWALAALADGGGRSRATWFAWLAVALLIAAALFVPWQVYTLRVFPVEAAIEHGYNLQHLFRPVEGHAGSAWYHLGEAREIYGKGAAFLVLPALYVLARRARSRALAAALLAPIAIAYLFFSLVATKMPAYCAIVSPLLYIALGTLLESAIAAGRSLVPQRGRRATAVVVLATLGWFDLGLRPGHHGQVPHAAGLPAGWQVREAAFYRSLPAELPPGRFAIFNCRRSYQAAADEQRIQTMERNAKLAAE